MGWDPKVLDNNNYFNRHLEEMDPGVCNTIEKYQHLIFHQLGKCKCIGIL